MGRRWIAAAQVVCAVLAAAGGWTSSGVVTAKSWELVPAGVACIGKSCHPTPPV